MDIQPFQQSQIPNVPALALSYPEHLSATDRAHALGCWPVVLQCYALRILHFRFGTAFEAVCLHLVYLPLLLAMDSKPFTPGVSIAMNTPIAN
jgi:hypothetical protein